MRKITNQELNDFEYMIAYKAKRFIRVNCGSSGDTKYDVSIRNCGVGVQDVEQELRIALWIALSKYDVKKTITQHGVCSTKTYVAKCLDRAAGTLAQNLFAAKRGITLSHDYESVIVGGEYAEET